jgi:ADP-heptose:LPS heptosyltransferase
MATTSGHCRAMRRLLVFFARVGDLVMFTPVIRQLARDGELDLLARPWARPLLAGQPGLAAIHTLGNPNRSGLWSRLLDGNERGRLEPVLAARNYDEIITFKGETAQVQRWISRWGGQATRRFVSRALPDAPRHQVDANRKALEFGGFSTVDFDPAPRLEVPAALLAGARHRLGALGRRVIALQAGSSLTHRWLRKQPNLKGLAPAQWGAFLERLLSEERIDAAVLHGSAPEGREARAIHAALAERWRGRVHDWTGQVPLGELPAVLAASHATVSVDTGPAHIAAAVGCPLLVLFGPTDPAVFAPRGAGRVEVLLGSAPCQFCHGNRLFKTCRANICLTTMTTETLVAGWRRLLGD